MKVGFKLKLQSFKKPINFRNTRNGKKATKKIRAKFKAMNNFYKKRLENITQINMANSKNSKNPENSKKKKLSKLSKLSNYLKNKGMTVGEFFEFASRQYNLKKNTLINKTIRNYYSFLTKLPTNNPANQSVNPSITITEENGRLQKPTVPPKPRSPRPSPPTKMTVNGLSTKSSNTNGAPQKPNNGIKSTNLATELRTAAAKLRKTPVTNTKPSNQGNTTKPRNALMAAIRDVKQLKKTPSKNAPPRNNQSNRVPSNVHSNPKKPKQDGVLNQIQKRRQSIAGNNNNNNPNTPNPNYPNNWENE
jgi:hypothetical protein